MRNIKCVVIGDGGVGKTCLVNSFVKSEFSSQQVPTAFESHSISATIEGRNVRMSLWDTAGQDDYDKLRPLSYPSTDIVIICFSVMNPASFGNVKSKWHSEIRKYCPNTPLLLVGTKCDLRHNEEAVSKLLRRSLRPINVGQGIAMAKDIEAIKYVQCSALTKTGIEHVFEEAVGTILSPACVRHQRKNCREKECRIGSTKSTKNCVIL